MGQSTTQRPSHQITSIRETELYECLKILTEPYVHEHWTIKFENVTKAKKKKETLVLRAESPSK